MAETLIPADVLRPLMRAWIDTYNEQRVSAGGLLTLGERTGISPRSLQRMMNEAQHVKFANADRILAAIDRPDAWHLELADYYHEEMR